MDIKAIVNHSDSAKGRAFNLGVQILILFSIVIFSIGTLPNLGDTARKLLTVTESVIVMIFSLEYLLRLYAAEKKTSYVFSFYGIIDLIAIIPFYVSSGIDLETLRALRLLHAFKLLNLIQYNKAIGRFYRAFLIAKEEIFLFGTVASILLYLSAVGIYFFEHNAQPEVFESIFHSLWWSIITLTTVGYGDIYPITAGGRMFTFFVLIIGLAIVAFPSGLLASALSKARMEDPKE